MIHVHSSEMDVAHRTQRICKTIF